MNLPNKQQLAIAAALILVGLLAGRYTKPDRVEIKIEERIVEKVVTKEAKTTNKNKEYVTIEIISPDGTIRREKRLIDKGTISYNKEAETNRESEKNITGLVENATAKYSVRGLFGVDMNKKFEKPIYGIQIDKQFIGPIRLGAFGLDNGTIGVAIGFNF